MTHRLIEPILVLSARSWPATPGETMERIFINTAEDTLSADVEVTDNMRRAFEEEVEYALNGLGYEIVFGQCVMTDYSGAGDYEDSARDIVENVCMNGDWWNADVVDEMPDENRL